MKTVKYRGVECIVSDWVNFIATDKDAQVIGYENKPILHEDQFLPAGGRWEFVDITEWENSLEKV